MKTWKGDQFPLNYVLGIFILDGLWELSKLLKYLNLKSSHVTENEQMRIDDLWMISSSSFTAKIDFKGLAW